MCDSEISSEREIYSGMEAAKITVYSALNRKSAVRQIKEKAIQEEGMA